MGDAGQQSDAKVQVGMALPRGDKGGAVVTLKAVGLRRRVTLKLARRYWTVLWLVELARRSNVAADGYVALDTLADEYTKTNGPLAYEVQPATVSRYVRDVNALVKKATAATGWPGGLLLIDVQRSMGVRLTPGCAVALLNATGEPLPWASEDGG